jgi:hypothetical protein
MKVRELLNALRGVDPDSTLLFLAEHADPDEADELWKSTLHRIFGRSRRPNMEVTYTRFGIRTHQSLEMKITQRSFMSQGGWSSYRLVRRISGSYDPSICRGNLNAMSVSNG